MDGPCGLRRWGTGILGAVCAIVAGNVAAVVTGGFALRRYLPRFVGAGGVVLGIIGLLSAA